MHWAWTRWQVGRCRRSSWGARKGRSEARTFLETLSTPVTSPQFADELADKVRMFVSKVQDDGPMTAELHLNPAEMGPINVRIAVDGQNAQVDFAAAAQETRKAIEASLAQLSSALDEVGLSLTGGGCRLRPATKFWPIIWPIGRIQPWGGNPHRSRRGNVRRTNGAPCLSRQVDSKGGLDLYA